jgi:YVTN family beta-propeller protein
MKSRLIHGMLPLLAAALLVTTENSAAAGYAVVNRWSLGPAAKWDYATFDTTRRRIFIAHGDRVIVVDSDSGEVVGEIPGTNGVHGIALAQEIKRGFTSNGKANTITVFDLDTLQRLEDVPVSGENPDAIVYEPSVGKVLTFNGRSNTVSVIDVKTLKEVATLKTAGKPEFAVSNGAGKVFFNIESPAGQMQVIDATTDQVLATWDLTGCSRPTGLAIDSKLGRLFSVCENEVMAVTDATTGKPVASVRIGAGPDAAGYDAETKTIFSSNGKSGSLTVIQQDDADHYRVIATVPTAASARTQALDPATHRLFLPSVTSGNMTLLVVGPE